MGEVVRLPVELDADGWQEMTVVSAWATRNALTGQDEPKDEIIVSFGLYGLCGLNPVRRRAKFFGAMEAFGLDDPAYWKTNPSLEDVAAELVGRTTIGKYGHLWGVTQPIMLGKTLVVGYGPYIESGVWKRTRRKLLELRGEECESGAAKHRYRKVAGPDVHHKTYARLGRELDTDLVVLCRGCHRKEHKAAA